MNINEAIKFLDKQVLDPSKGLPQEVFFYVSRMTPLVNVDLLIKDKNGRTLLAWRDDKYTGKGWHVPGGIVRFKEKLEARLQQVARKEIGAMVKFNPIPIAIIQSICKKNTRGHFISILYECFLTDEFVPENKNLTDKDAGYLKWHESCPKDLLEAQKIYKKYI